MKRQDIAILIAVVGFAAIFSFVASGFLFKAGDQNLTAEKVDPITADFPAPDNRVFNDNALNPTKLIQIGDGSNPQPF